jgi:glycosyltransferase involved in cell wall biosynthesis
LPTEPSTPALFLAAETPYPLAGGGALRSASVLNYLARTREVDIIVFRQPGSPDPASRIPAGLARRIVAIDLPHHGRGIAARGFRNLARLAREAPPLVDRFAGFEAQIEEAVAGRRYGIGIVEHFWCAPYWEQISRVCDRTVLDLHNVESELHARCAQTEPGAAGFAHRMFRQPSLALEREWLPRYSCVLAASQDDAQAARAIAPRSRVGVYPNAIPATARPPRKESNTIVFSANMAYHPNISAVRFFRREIWPLLRDRWPELVWTLVGKNPEGIRRFVSGDDRIEVRGPVEDAVTELARARVAVVPVLAGSGTRIKILEAWAAGTPVVSTTMGAEGLPVVPGGNILLADTAPAFANAVSTLLGQPRLAGRLGMAGRELLEREFTWESAWEKLSLFLRGDW